MSSPCARPLILGRFTLTLLVAACGSELSGTNDTAGCGCAMPVCDYEDGKCYTDEFEGPWCGIDSLHDFLDECPSRPASPCGLIEEFCYQDTMTYDCIFDESGEWLRYSETSLECGLIQLRDRTPGTLTWQSTRDYNITGYRGLLQITEEGQVLGNNCTYADVSSTFVEPNTVELKPAAYFDDCLALPEPSQRWQCMHAGITESDTIPQCRD